MISLILATTLIGKVEIAPNIYKLEYLTSDNNIYTVIQQSSTQK